MDRIYRSAKLVAASGHDAEVGLPGVRFNSWCSNQAIEEVQGLTLAKVLPGKREITDRPLWNQRGWTYQERLFSKRLPCFCEDCADDEFNMADFYSKH